MKVAKRFAAVIVTLLGVASIAAAYNAEAIFFDISSDADTHCAFYDAPCKRGIYVEARDSWAPVAQDANAYVLMLYAWGTCNYDPNLCLAAQNDADQLANLMMLIENAIMEHS